MEARDKDHHRHVPSRDSGHSVKPVKGIAHEEEDRRIGLARRKTTSEVAVDDPCQIEVEVSAGWDSNMTFLEVARTKANLVPDAELDTTRMCTRVRTSEVANVGGVEQVGYFLSAWLKFS